MEYVSEKRFPVNAKDYKLYEEVGEGVSASVYRALCVPLNEIVAIKVLDLEKCNNDLDGIRREVHTMSLIDHPNVLRAHCSFTSGHSLWVVMPYMSGGSCLHIMKSGYPEGFEEPVIATLLREVLKALVYLHAHGYIHRDVKAGNILIDSNGVVKLADFGVSAGMFDTGDRQRSRNTFVGTPCWMAPEVMQQLHGYDFKADIWSFGITALELAHGHAPFSKYPPMKVLLMTLQNAPPGLDYERDKRFSKCDTSFSMGFLKHLLIETKVFVLSVEGGNHCRITERGRKVTKEIILNLASARWLANSVEECLLSGGRKVFYKNYRDGTKALFIHRRFNAYGRFLEVTDYGDGSGGRGLLAIPEGVEGKGWKIFSSELMKALPRTNSTNQAPAFPRLGRDEVKGKEKVGLSYSEVVWGGMGSSMVVSGNNKVGVQSRVHAEKYDSSVPGKNGSMSNVCNEDSHLQKALLCLKGEVSGMKEELNSVRKELEHLSSFVVKGLGLGLSPGLVSLAGRKSSKPVSGKAKVGMGWRSPTRMSWRRKQNGPYLEKGSSSRLVSEAQFMSEARLPSVEGPSLVAEAESSPEPTTATRATGTTASVPLPSSAPATESPATVAIVQDFSLPPQVLCCSKVHGESTDGPSSLEVAQTWSPAGSGLPTDPPTVAQNLKMLVSVNSSNAMGHGVLTGGTSSLEVAQTGSPAGSGLPPVSSEVKSGPPAVAQNFELNPELVGQSGLAVAQSLHSAPSELGPLSMAVQDVGSSDQVGCQALEMADEPRFSEQAGSLVLFAANKEGEDEPSPLYSYHPNVSDWVTQMAMDIKHMVGISYGAFEAEFLALLIAVEAINVQPKSDQSLASAKKRERELKRLSWAMIEDEGMKSSNRERSKGRGKMVVP